MENDVQLERTFAFGRKLGLDVADVQLIVETWSAYARTSARPVPWSRVRESLQRKANDLPYLPRPGL